jgi:glycosyltransferase involved in cell wall biosynthesis
MSAGMPAEGLRVLHLVERLSLGGAGRSLIAAAQLSRASHSIYSLRPPDPAALALAQSAGLPVTELDALASQAGGCDILHVHFWNTPELFDALRRPLPPVRLLLTSHVTGCSAPHILTQDVRALADRVIATAPGLAADDTIPPAADFSRISPGAPHGGGPFAIAYVGALDFAKLHPEFVAMHQGLGGDYRVLVAGDGADALTLRRQAEAAGAAHRFHWLGYTENISELLLAADVFGYPLRPETFATGELVLHEAMFAGLPCVLLAGGGAAHTLVDGETGYIVHNADEYAQRMRQLRADPALRHVIGAAAAAYARAHLGAANIAPRIDAVYAAMMDNEPRTRQLAQVGSGCEAFLRSLGDHGETFYLSLASDAAADEQIFAASPALASADTGGVLHYRRFYPDDAALRYWSGLVLLAKRRAALAAGEFKAAREMGFDAIRCNAWLREAIQRARTTVH